MRRPVPIKAVRSIRGTFRAGLAFNVLGLTMSLVACALAKFAIEHALIEPTHTRRVLLEVLGGASIIFAAFIAAAYLSTRYVFSDSAITCYIWRSTIRWSGALQTLAAASEQEAQGYSVLILDWPDGMRRGLLMSGALRAAIRVHDTPPPNYRLERP